MAPAVNGPRFFLFLVAPLSGSLLTAAIVRFSISVSEEKERRAREEAAAAAQAEARKGWSYWTPLTAGFQAARSGLDSIRASGWGWSPLKKGFHAVKSGLEWAAPSGGWTSAVSQGALSTAQGLVPNVKVGAASGGGAESTGSLRVTVGAAPPPGLPPSHAVVLWLTVVDGKYVLDLLCSDERRVLDLRKKLLATAPSAEEAQVPTSHLLALQAIGSFSRYALGLPPCSLQDLVKIKDYAERCISGDWSGIVPANLKEVVSFFTRQDLTWALGAAIGIAEKLNCPEALSGLARKALDLGKGASFYVYKLGRFLPGSGRRASSPAGDGEAASLALGAELLSGVAPGARRGQVFVVVTDENGEVKSVEELLRDGDGGPSAA